MAGRKGAIAPIVIGVVGCAILVILGTWQVERLTWKEGLIAELQARLAADPVPLPATPDTERDQNLRVGVTGTILPEELHVLTSIKNVGPGFRVISPMELDDGRRIMVDMGYVRETLKDIATRSADPRASGDGLLGEVVGVLRWPEPDSYAPPPDQNRKIWFDRVVPDMAAALGTEPILVIAERHPLDQVPLPRPPGVDLPNRHLEYAVTWFGLALVWAIMSIVWLRRELRAPRSA
ncbi:MAG: SURF1 family protein [Pseudomonadota bacterium]